MTIDKICSIIGDQIFEHISGLTKDEAEKMLANLNREINVFEPINGYESIVFKLKVERKYLEYRLEAKPNELDENKFDENKKYKTPSGMGGSYDIKYTGIKDGHYTFNVTNKDFDFIKLKYRPDNVDENVFNN